MPPVGRPEAAELGRRLDDLLAEAERLVRPVPAAAMAPLCDTAFRAFRLALAFVDGMDRGRVEGEWRGERAPGMRRPASRPAAERLAQALADAEEQLAQLRRALPRPGGAS